MILNPVKITFLEKIAVDNGFDLERGQEGDWLVFGSSQAFVQIWLAAPEDALFLVAFSRSDISDMLINLGEAADAPFPKGAAAVRVASGLPSLHRLVRRSFQLARALPDEPLKTFRNKTANLPRSTEAERLVVQRVGQEIFRDRLLDYWEGRCAITGLNVPELLRASHVKPWAACETDAERLDVFNGLLLAPHLDAAFDGGFITVADEGGVILADALDHDSRKSLNLLAKLRIDTLAKAHQRYLIWHRRHVFRGAQEGDLK